MSLELQLFCIRCPLGELLSQEWNPFIMYKILWNVLKTVFAGGVKKHWESIKFEDSENHWDEKANDCSADENYFSERRSGAFIGTWAKWGGLGKKLYEVFEVTILSKKPLNQKTWSLKMTLGFISVLRQVKLCCSNMQVKILLAHFRQSSFPLGTQDHHSWLCSLCPVNSGSP